jgi:c-di-AMP phosphodiesterase-like protein
MIILVMYFFFLRTSSKRRREILRYVDSLEHGTSGVVNSVTEAPFPIVIFKINDGEVIWCNELFYSIVGEKEHVFEIKVTDMLPGFSFEWLREGKSESPEPVYINDRIYSVSGCINRQGGPAKNIFATLYFTDETEFFTVRKKLLDTRLVFGTILIDNYDEVTKGLNDSQKNAILSELDTRLDSWLEEKNYLLRKVERERYILFCEHRDLDAFIKDKFSILDQAREISSGDIPVTLSIGFGIGSDNYDELSSFSSIAIDMALSRGGDQAVIKNESNFEFYGGRTQEIEKRTKVKSRVMANALKQLINDSSTVFVMGHKNSDVDSVGAAAGIICACRKLGKKAHIVIDMRQTAAELLVKKLLSLEEYDGVFISPSEAMVAIGPKSLIVVVDVNRPEVVESPDLLTACRRIAVIDHHRRSASYIENAALNLHEPYASSASELVCELLGYLGEKAPLLKPEAEALLAGIVLDTKSFTMRTGVRTFEAAATLRQAGADTIEVKRFFQTGQDEYLHKYNVMSKAIMYKNEISVAALDYTEDRTVAAQAADELLNVLDVQASFVIFPEGDEIIISARSLGKINVQVILEKLGGGGHLNMAGAQIKDQGMDVTMSRLYEAIDDYMLGVR